MNERRIINDQTFNIWKNQRYGIERSDINNNVHINANNVWNDAIYLAIIMYVHVHIRKMYLIII